MKSIQVEELRKRLQHREPWLLLDVRQQEEYDICNFEGVVETWLIPLNKLGIAVERIPKDRPVAVCCHHGVRSMYAIECLEQQGFQNLYNLEGGIHAWAREIDPQMSLY